MSNIALLVNASSDWTGTAKTPKIDQSPLKSALVVWGALGGGTVKLQQTVDGGTTWLDLVTVTAPGQTAVDIFHEGNVRVSLSGSTTPSGVNAVLYGPRAPAAITTG